MALPDYSNGGFYNPSQTYRGRWSGTSGATPIDPFLANAYGTNDDPRAAFNVRLGEMGLLGGGSRAKAAQNMYGQAQAGYGAAKLNSNFELFFPEYLDQIELDKIINSQSYEAQGLDAGRYGQRKYRWGQRSS